MKNTLGIIPARMASSRFPGKPLKKIFDIPMLAHCYERALMSGACDKLVISTPDQEIIDWANSHDIPALLTSHNHKRASDRAKETTDILSRNNELYDLILLLQGDEPQIFPNDINNLKNAFTGKEFEVINLIYPVNTDDIKDPNVVKAIVDINLKIVFFSRSHIPHNSTNSFRQLGVIGFSNQALQCYSALLPTPMEEIESIDMMRFLENNLCIQGVLSSSPILGVDQPEDIKKIEESMLDDKLIHLYKNRYI